MKSEHVTEISYLFKIIVLFLHLILLLKMSLYPSKFKVSSETQSMITSKTECS